MSTEVDVKDILDRLGKKLGQLQIDNEILTAQIEKLQAQVSNGHDTEVTDAELMKEVSNGRRTE